MSVLLEVNGISVSFDGFKAINNLSFSISNRELRAIIGPNGAGKTTFMDIVTGKTKPDAGTVQFVSGRLEQGRARLCGLAGSLCRRAEQRPAGVALCRCDRRQTASSDGGNCRSPRSESSRCVSPLRGLDCRGARQGKHRSHAGSDQSA